MEWAAPSPPPHGNFAEVPEVYRGPYEYSVPGTARDFSPQHLAEVCSDNADCRQAATAPWQQLQAIAILVVTEVLIALGNLSDWVGPL